MRLRSIALLGLAFAAFCAAAQPTAYYPDRDWRHQTPADAGIDAAKLKDAIDFAVAAESHYPRDAVLTHYQTFGREPFGYAIGPIKDRGDPTGLVVHHGYIVAEWGEPTRVDMTHSVTKSLLSSVIGVALRPRHDREPRRSGARLRGPDRAVHPLRGGDKSDRLGAQRLRSASSTRRTTHDHLGPHAAPDERLGRHAVGQAGLGRPPRAARGMAHAQAQPARHRRTSTTTRA